MALIYRSMTGLHPCQSFNNDTTKRPATHQADGGESPSAYHPSRHSLCIRLYNRCLTAAEVTADYKVDVTRFGIGNTKKSDAHQK